jgi:thiol-disulfide isomerase/thioredoxin
MSVVKLIAKSAKSFFSSKFNIALVIALVIIGAFSFFMTAEEKPAVASGEVPAVYFFYLPTCPHCTEQKPIYYELKSERTDVEFFEYDASSQQGSQLFYKLAADAGLDTSRLGVPTIFVGKNALVGFQSKENLMNAIDECINQCKGEEYHQEIVQEIDTGFSDFELPFLGRVDLTKWSLPTLAVVLGLVDGFNPCAMWVLIFIITMLLGEKSKKKIWIVVGSFVLASAISYFLFMTAWLNLFLLIGYIRILTLLIGLFALGMGILNLKEVITTKGGLTCKVTDAEDKEKTMNKIQNILSQPVTWGVLLAIIGLAFTVNAIEFVCSAAIPAVFTQVLSLSNISSVMHYTYITIYVFFYMLDHIIIFGMAAFALGSGIIGEKYAKLCKLVGGIIMLVLGLIMLFAPHLLR